MREHATAVCVSSPPLTSCWQMPQPSTSSSSPLRHPITRRLPHAPLSTVSPPLWTNPSRCMRSMPSALSRRPRPPRRFPPPFHNPLAVHAVDAEPLIEAAAAAGVFLTVFQNRRWDGDFLTVTRLLSEGTLGDIYRFESRFEWLNPRPRPAWKTGTSGLDGGGVAYDLGAHLIDQALQLFGPPTEVYGELLTHSPGAVNDDDSFIAIHHESGVRSHLWMSSHVAQRGPRFRVLGSASAYTKWGLDQQESQLASGMDPSDARFGVSAPETWGVLGPDGDTSPVPTERGRYTEFYAGVVAAITGGGTSVDPRDAVAGVRMIEHLHAQ